MKQGQPLFLLPTNVAYTKERTIFSMPLREVSLYNTLCNETYS